MRQPFLFIMILWPKVKTRCDQWSTDHIGFYSATNYWDMVLGGYCYSDFRCTNTNLLSWITRCHWLILRNTKLCIQIICWCCCPTRHTTIHELWNNADSCWNGVSLIFNHQLLESLDVLSQFRSWLWVLRLRQVLGQSIWHNVTEVILCWLSPKLVKCWHGPFWPTTICQVPIVVVTC